MGDSRVVAELWNEIPFWGNKVEETVWHCWWAVFLVPLAVLLLFGQFLKASSAEDATVLLRDPYMCTFLIALFISTMTFEIWQSTMRDVFGKVVESGLVSEEPSDVARYVAESHKFVTLIRSPFRVILIFTLLVTAFIATDGIEIVTITFPVPVECFRILIELSFLVFAYGIGAVAWTLASAARWIGSLSRSDMLRIQIGHSDGCCGFEGLGDCVLQSVLPLVIGMALCLVWSYSRHFRFFTHKYDEQYFSMIVPFSRLMIVAMFALTCVLVFLPIRGLHFRLKDFKRTCDKQFALALENEVEAIPQVLVSDIDIQRASYIRLKLVRALDPSVLKLSTWPFDRSSLVKYGITPIISLAASIGRELMSTLGIIRG